jgi:uncharacterized protein (TIGR03435 family)
MLGVSVGGQTPAFDVASVKLSQPDTSSPIGSIPMIMVPPGGRFTARNVTLRMLLQSAYGVTDAQIIGGPSWEISQKFDISAKADAVVLRSAADLGPLLKGLLADRFRLKAHTETRELPVSVLAIARSDGRLGRDLKPSKSDCTNAQAEMQKRADALMSGGPAAADAIAQLMPKPGQTMKCAMMPLVGTNIADFGMHGDGQPISVISSLVNQATGKIVIDETGLTGLFDWDLRFDPNSLLAAAARMGVTLPPPALPQSDSPSVVAAVREQLGLKVEDARRPVEVLVIDSVELPTPD